MVRFFRLTHSTNGSCMKYLSSAVFIFSILFIISCEGEKQPPVIPVENFFKNPVKTEFSLSPAGDKIAYLESWNSRLNIFIMNLEDSTVQRITNSIDRDIIKFFWVNENRLVYLQDINGNESFQLYSLNADGTDHKLISPKSRPSVRIIDLLKNEPEKILVQMNMRRTDLHDVFKLNVNTGKTELIAKNSGSIVRWITDNEGRLRIAITTDGKKTGILYRDIDSENFEPVILTDFMDELVPLHFDENDRYIYALSNIGRDKKALVKYDLQNNREIEKIYSNQFVDVEGTLWSEKEKKLLAAEYVKERKEYYFLDKNIELIFDKLQNKFPGEEISIQSKSKDENEILFKLTSDVNPGEWYFYNIPDGTLKKLSVANPTLNKYYLSEMKPVSFTSRDGNMIHGYLTLPRGIAPEKIPTVVVPHGGPWLRDYWQYNPSVQFFANRGYAVLQVNYRGSEGYGKKFYSLGFKEWGLAMQNDITDGVDWLIRQGIADSERIAIAGYSYGGYAALAGITFTKDKYKCGVIVSGLPNILSFLNKIPPAWKPFRNMLYTMVGDPVKDSVQLWQTSPYFHTDKVKVPVLIAHGKNDPKVNYREIENYIADLKKHNVKVTGFFKENEGHYFRNEENRIELYKEIESFLFKYLNGRKEGEMLSK